jgi:hypothetical protein
MIKLTDLPAVLEITPVFARSLRPEVIANPTSKAVVGIFVNACQLQIEDAQFADGFDIFHIADIYGKIRNFAIVCISGDQVSNPQQLAEQVEQQLRKMGFYDRANIIFFSNPIKTLQPYLAFSEITFVFLSTADIVQLLYTNRSTSESTEFQRDRLITKIIDATPSLVLNPYVFRGPIDDSLFVGRKRILEALEKVDASWAIVGPRSIGKSSLVNKFARRLKLKGIVVLKTEFGGTLSEYSVIQKFIQQLVDNYEISPRFLNEVAVSSLERLITRLVESEHRKVRIVIDEADEFVARCPNLAASLRRLHNENYARVVLVGYKRLRQSLSDATGILFNTVQRLQIGTMSVEECGAIALKPATQLGVTFEDIEEIASILHHSSGGAPSRVQLLCHAMFNTFENRAKRHITVDLAKTAIQLPEVRDEVFNWYFASTTPLERALASIIAIQPSVMLPALRKDIVRALASDHQISADKLNLEIQHLILADVLREENEKVFFTFPELVSLVKPTGDVRSAWQQFRRSFRESLEGDHYAW